MYINIMVIASTGPISFLDIQNEFGGTNPIAINEYYTDANPSYTSGVTGIPALGSSIAVQHFQGKAKPSSGITINAPSGAITSVSAFTLSNLTNGAKVTNWSSFSQANVSLQPTYQSGTTFPYVKFTGTSSNVNWMVYSAATSLNYSTNGGSTMIMLGRYNNLVPFNRTLAHTGGSGTANTFEWIMAEDNYISYWTSKYYYVNNVGVKTANSNNVPLGKVSLYVARFTNSTTKAELFRNNVSIASTTHAALPNSTTANFYLGSQGGGTASSNLDMTDIIYAAYYARPVTNTELTTLYNSVSSICEN